MSDGQPTEPTDATEPVEPVVPEAPAQGEVPTEPVDEHEFTEDNLAEFFTTADADAALRDPDGGGADGDDRSDEGATGAGSEADRGDAGGVPDAAGVPDGTGSDNDGAPAADRRDSDPDGADDGSAEPDPEPAPTGGLIEFGGQTYRRGDVERVVAWAESLTPEQVAAMQGATQQQAPAPAQPTPTPTAPQPDAPQMPDLSNVADPELAQYMQAQFAAQAAEIERLQAIEQQRYQAEAAQRQVVLQTALDSASSTIVERYGLTDAETSQLLAKANESNVMTFAGQQYGLDNPQETFERGFELLIAQTPEFQQKAIEARAKELASEIIAKDAEARATAQTDTRRQINSSLVGAGAAAPRAVQTIPAAGPERDAAMVAEIADAMRPGNQ